MIESTIYPNNFHFIHQEAVHSLPLCSIHLFCDVGSSFETNELRGIAHLLEHMLFQGTKTKTANILFKQYDRIGTEFNAHTTKRYTRFHIKCHDQHAKRVIELLSDVMKNSTMKKSTISKEMKIVNQENKNFLTNYYAVAMNNFESKIFKNSSFESAVDDFSYKNDKKKLESIQDWYEWFYRPSNMVLSVVSNKKIDFWKKILFSTEFTSEEFRKNTKIPKNVLKFPINKNIGMSSNIDIILSRKNHAENTNIVFGFRTVNQYSDKKYLFELLTHILNGMSGRLFMILRQTEHLVYNITSSSEQEEFTGYFSIYTEFSDEHVFEILKLIIKLFKDLSKNGVNEEEFHIGKSRLRGYYEIQYEDMDTFAEHNGYEQLVFVRKTENSRHYKKDKIQQYQTIFDDHIEPITIEQINASMREYFQINNMVVSLVSSQKIDLDKIKKICMNFL